jgi:DNA modification methylase
MKPYYSNELGVIYHGDCLEILPQIEKVDLVLTDPPYGAGLSFDYADRFKNKAGKWWNNTDRSIQKRHKQVKGDEKPFNPTPLLNLKAKEYILWGGNWYASRLPDSGGWWIWDKRGGERNVSKADWPMSEAEIAWTNIGKGTRIFRHTWFGLIRDSERGEWYHPTQKPVALMIWCIKKTKTKGLIFDPYMGSGSVFLASIANGRTYIGCEKDEEYCEIAAKRCEEVRTGLTPEEQEAEQQLLFVD